MSLLTLTYKSLNLLANIEVENNIRFERFFESDNYISIPKFIFNIILAFILSYIFSKIYIRYGQSLSNRSSFSQNFSLITMTTMTIITIVKSSMALSLGLVGALSIVRFRTALKEPEELAYTFFCIAIGLGLGANQTLITIISFAIISISIVIRKRFSSSLNINGMNLTITSSSKNLVNFDSIIDDLYSICESIDLKRVSDDNNDFQTSIIINIKNYKDIDKIRNILKNKYENLSIDFVDTSNILNT